MTKGKKEELLKVKDLALGYDGSVIAENLSFTVSEGDYLCIVGENGSGKTTLMKTLLGLQKPLRGTITFRENLSSGMIGWLPQQTQVQKDFPASVREIVLSGCLGQGSFHPFYTKEEKQRAQDAMERLGIASLSAKSFRTLSGGQQQRVLLARALCAAGKILLLDEPTAGLDPKVTAELYTLVRELNKSGITVIMVSHDIAAAVRCATHILHIGTFNFFGTKEAYIGSRAGRYFLNEEGGAQ